MLFLSTHTLFKRSRLRCYGPNPVGARLRAVRGQGGWAGGGASSHTTHGPVFGPLELSEQAR
eukprot:5789133-Prymnesium_polylepis.1